MTVTNEKGILYRDIVLDPSLKPVDGRMREHHLGRNSPVSIAQEFGKKLGLLDYDKHFKLVGATLVYASPFDHRQPMQEGFVGLLSRCYSLHDPVVVNPHDLWFLVLTELAIQIKANAEKCRPIFTSSDEKQVILVPSADPTHLPLDLVVEELERRMPEDNADIFMPLLSTHTEESRLAMYAALADCASPYYNYMTFMCGIPAVRLTGNAYDWVSLYASARTLAEAFRSYGMPDVAAYMTRVTAVFERIRDTVLHGIVDLDFWRGIFTQKNVGSGGQVDIDGWIADLFFGGRKLKRLENYTSNAAVFPYKNLETQRSFKGVHGAFGTAVTPDGFHGTQYGRLTFETTT